MEREGGKRASAEQILPAETLPLEEIVPELQNPKRRELMPVSKKKGTTSSSTASTPESSSLIMPDQHAFHQCLRALAQSAVRTVIETLMREELDTFIAAACGEWSRQQRGLSQWLQYPRPGNIHWPHRSTHRSPEIGKVSYTPRSLSAISAMNPLPAHGSCTLTNRPTSSYALVELSIDHICSLVS